MNTYKIYYYDSNYHLVDNGETVKYFKSIEHAISFAKDEMSKKNAKHFEIYQIVFVVQDYAAIIMGVYESKNDAQANLQEGWYVTAYEVKPKSNNKNSKQ